MQIRYAVSTMIFWGREDPLSFEQDCQFLKSLGFGIELLPNIAGYSDCRYQRRNWSRLAEATRGMLVVMRSRSDRPSSDQWQEQIECAQLLRARIVTDLAALRIRDGAEVDGCDFAAAVIDSAQRHKVKLCVETGQLQTIRQLGDRFDSIRYCLDTGHANLDPVDDFRQYVDELAEQVEHLHLTDNYGQTDDHEVPGLRGGIGRENWDYLLDALGRYDNDIIGTLEMCPCQPGAMIRQASEFLFDELKWPNPPRRIVGYTHVGYDRR